MQLLSEEEKNDRNVFPLTKVQHAIWISQRLHPMSALFNIGGYAVIQGEVDRDVFQQAIDALIRQNNALRIRMTSLDGKEALYFDENYSLEVPFYDFSASENAVLDCENWINENFKISANIETEFFTTVLLKSAENTFYWYVKVHHLIADGFSLSLIFNQVTEIYSQLKNTDFDTSEPFYDFTKHLLEDQSYTDSVKYENDKAFWIEKFKNAPDVIQYEKIPGIDTSFFSARKEIILKRPVYNEICALAESHGIVDFHYFLSLFYTLINKVFDQENFVVGIPLLNRNGRISKNTVGAFLNFLPITLSGASEDDILRISRKTKEEISGCYRHSKFPMIDLMEELDNGKTVYNTLFSFERNSYLSDFDGNPVSIHHMPRNEQLEDLSVHILDYNDSWDVRIIFDYKIHLFSEEQIGNLTEQFQHLLENAVGNTLLPLKKVHLKKNDTHVGVSRTFSSTENLLGYFGAQVTENPDNTAFEFEENIISYSELDRQSNRIAHYLRNDCKLKQGDLVGVFLKRSEQLLPALIGILKSGGAYLPIDPDLPESRIAHYVNDSSLKLILSQELFQERLQLFDENVVFLEEIEPIKKAVYFEPIDSSLSANDLCYVIYTSGSTGAPKGVEITHGNVLNLLIDLQERIAISASDRFLATTTYSFDISVLELFLPLITGATVVLASSEMVKDAVSLKKVLSDSDISFMQATPSAWQMLFDSGWSGNQGLKILCGGELL
ncbi:MAG: AMP-binding protein, partial [Bacteroidetes bacterium]|nr:AMP-binding protein [Bacteroidota bacterium]